MGTSEYSAGEFGSARAAFQASLSLAGEHDDLRRRAEILTWIGLAAWHLGYLDTAEEYHRTAIDLEERSGLKDLLPRSYNALGLTLWDGGRLTEAREAYQRTRAAASEIGDVEYQYKPTMNLALVAVAFGEFDECRALLLDALDGGRELGIPALEIRSLVNLAMLEIRIGQPRRALDWLRKARALDVASDPVGEESYWRQLVSAYKELGEPGPALTALDSSLRLAQAQGLRQAEAANLELMAELHAEAGDVPRALAIYRDAAAIDSAVGLDEERATDLQKMAGLHATLGNLELAERYTIQALGIHESLGTRFAELDDLLLLADLKSLRGDRRGADQQLESARASADQLDVAIARLDVTLSAATIADRRGDARAVLRELDDAAPQLEQADFNIVWRVNALRSHAYAALGDPQHAIAAGRAALEAVKRARGQFSSDILRSRYASARLAPYVGLVGILLDQRRTEEAFSVADAAHRATLASIASPEPSTGVPATADTAARRLLHRIDAVVVSLRDAEMDENTTQVRELQAALERTRREYALRLVHAAEQAGGPPRGSNDEPSDLEAIQSMLTGEEVLIEYLVGDSAVTIFTVTSDTLIAQREAVPVSTLTSQVRLARQLVEEPGAGVERSRAVLTALRRRLIGPALMPVSRHAQRRLIIVPHGVLSYLPFAALIDASSGHYLVEDASLAFLPSADALVTLRTRVAAGGDSSTFAAFAPFVETLPATGGEVEVAHSILERGTVFRGTRATETVLRTALARDGVVHVASHGVMNPRSPLFSRVELAPGDESDPANDGRLEVHEVLNMRIASSLVFLSGCETAVGASWSTSFSPGEDYATLARAFLRAGANEVIATLWTVDDEGAAELARQFYGALTTHEPAEALARAQRALLAGGRYEHPYYWAGYRLAGSGGVTSAASKAGATAVSYRVP